MTCHRSSDANTSLRYSKIKTKQSKLNTCACCVVLSGVPRAMFTTLATLFTRPAAALAEEVRRDRGGVAGGVGCTGKFAFSEDEVGGNEVCEGWALIAAETEAFSPLSGAKSRRKEDQINSQSCKNNIYKICGKVKGKHTQ